MAGWLMMPLALLLLWVELHLMARLFVAQAVPQPLPMYAARWGDAE
jgi:hypothetical protein